MDSEYQDSSSMCCCGRSEYDYRNKCSFLDQRDISSDDEKECNNYSPFIHEGFYKSNQPPSNHYVLKDQSWKSHSTLRGKSCPCSIFELEESAAADPLCSHNIYEKENQYWNAPLLRRANEVIDYVPESEFLKKMKQQCHYLDNSQPNTFFSIDDFMENGVSSYECQKCEASSNFMSKQRGQRCDKVKSASVRLWERACSQQSCRNDGQVLNKNFANVQSEKCKMQKMTEKEPEKKNQTNEKSKAIKKKSEHISRSKKPSRYGGRRKRKSVSLEKFESSDQFEPTLKKPHENSCERCWRYASPSRSPVNKPDQKYDPNFRRGHSYMDLEKGDGDVVDRESQLKNSKPVFYNGKERSPCSCCCRQQKSHVARSPSVPVTKKQISALQPSLCTSTKVKELLTEQPLRKPLENYLSTAQNKDSSKVHKSGLPECDGILLSDTKGKLRPRSYSPGLSSPKMSRCPHVANDFVPKSKNFKTVCANSRKYFSDTPNTGQSLKISESLRPSTFKESTLTSPRGSSNSPGRLFIHSSLKPIPEAVTTSSKESESESVTSGVKSSLKKLEKHGTPKTQSKTKNLKASSSKKPATGATKPKVNQRPASSKAKNIQQITKFPKNSPQTPKSQTNSVKLKCSQDILEDLCADKKKFKSTTNSDSLKYRHNSKPSCGNTAEHETVSHALRECCCYPRLPVYTNGIDEDKGPFFCCHCNWGENRSTQTNSHSFKSSGIHPTHEENVKFHREPNTESDKRGFMKNQEYKLSDYSRTQKPSSLESSFVPNSSGMGSASSKTNAEFSGRTLPCPYRQYMNQEISSKSHDSPESGGNLTSEKEKSSTKYEKAREDKELFLGCSPRKYFVFYMTKSKEHKKGDDVEVLVEEFGQAPADERDTRTKGIVEKMKKILECPVDSMALRFQKGVTETCKTPPSSRILYF